MIELRYNKDGKLEYRTSGTIPNKPSQEAVDKLRSIIGSNADISVHPDSITHWNEWIVVPSEQTKSYTSGIVTNNYTSGIVWVHREAVDALIEEERRERDEAKAFWIGELRSRTDERDAARTRVAELEAEKQTLLESEMWGVNCKPSAPDWLTKKDRETLLRLSYSLDYVYATSADFIRSLLARSTPKVKEESNG